MATGNPIVSVGGVSIPCPSSYKYDLQDVSASKAGRTEDGKMHKKRIGQCVKLELEWQNVTTAVVSQILQAFNAEYLNIAYLDAKSGSVLTKEFYVGDRSAPMYNGAMGLWSNVSFNVIERNPTKVSGDSGADG